MPEMSGKCKSNPIKTNYLRPWKNCSVFISPSKFIKGIQVQAPCQSPERVITDKDISCVKNLCVKCI